MLKVLMLLFASLMVCSSSYGQYLGPFTSKDTAPLLAKLRNCPPDTSRVMLTIQLSDQYFYRAGRTANELDSAVFYNNAAKKLATSLAFERGLALVYFQQADIFPLINLREKGKEAGAKSIALFSRQKNYMMLGESYYRQASFYNFSEIELSERIRFFQKSLNAFGLAGSTLKKGMVATTLGEHYFFQGNHQQALSALKQALQYFQQVRYKRLMGVYDLLGLVYADLGAPNEGIKFGLLALRNAKELGDSTLQVCTFHNRLGLTYNSIGEYKKAYDHYQEGLRIARKYEHPESVHLIASNAATALSRLDRRPEAIALLNDVVKKYPLQTTFEKLMMDRNFVSLFTQQKQFKAAEKYVNELRQIETTQSPKDNETNEIHKSLIPYYLASGNYPAAKKYLALHKIFAYSTGTLKNICGNLLWQSQLDSISGNYLSAIANYQKYSSLKDSIFNETKSRQIRQLEIIYDMEKKDENIQLLTKQSHLQLDMLKQASVVQNITFISMALLLIIIGLLVAGYRLIKKNNKNMAARQEEIHSKNITLGHLLTEKEWLIKEIHHRVKNNLHMIVGLLESQSEFLKGDEARMAVAESQHRIQSMSMIHQKLYQSENLSSIDISSYIHELVQFLKDSLNPAATIVFELDIARLEMNISHSIPLGLILNEAITNSIKYAFPKYRNGKITVSLKQFAPQHFTLTIADNGIGLAPDFSISKSGSLGLTLIQGLCDDIGGRLSIGSNNGTVISIDFQYDSVIELAIT
ncbi:MAG: histidine kinase dimerization/phosphoacceptor domain -containing protein [Dyadobacter sp.]|uniref:histidine kinase dimerization/phosphoacceptor domain -containing protein n=1 Tax=Dyadobacter sp. TaxID=1914288 RepID=UPI003264BB9F